MESLQIYGGGGGGGGAIKQSNCYIAVILLYSLSRGGRIRLAKIGQKMTRLHTNPNALRENRVTDDHPHYQLITTTAHVGDRCNRTSLHN